MACMNTEFIRLCVEADSRIRTVMVSIRYWAAIYGLSGTYFKGTRILGLTHISYSASMSMLWFDTLFLVILWPLKIPFKLTDSELFIFWVQYFSLSHSRDKKLSKINVDSTSIYLILPLTLIP